jgi:hypothetical protein
MTERQPIPEPLALSRLDRVRNRLSDVTRLGSVIPLGFMSQGNYSSLIDVAHAQDIRTAACGVVGYTTVETLRLGRRIRPQEEADGPPPVYRRVGRALGSFVPSLAAGYAAYKYGAELPPLSQTLGGTGIMGASLVYLHSREARRKSEHE